MDPSPIYRVRIAGQASPAFAARLTGLLVTVEDGDTVITGPSLDQAALHGLLRLVRDLALPLVAVTRVDVAPLGQPNLDPDSKEDLP